MSEFDQILHRLEQVVSEATRVIEDLRALRAGKSVETNVGTGSDESSPAGDFLRQTQAISDFEVSRSFLHKLGVKQLKEGATWIIRLPNGHLRYSRSGLDRYFKTNPVRRRR
jgi:hypothetical protein